MNTSDQTTPNPNAPLDESAQAAKAIMLAHAINGSYQTQADDAEIIRNMVQIPLQAALGRHMNWRHFVDHNSRPGDIANLHLELMERRKQVERLRAVLLRYDEPESSTALRENPL